MTDIDGDWLKERLLHCFEGEQIRLIEALSSSSTNPCFRIQTQYRDYFCKVLHHDVLPVSQRKKLFSMQHQLALQHIAVKPVQFIEAHRIWIDEWITGSALSDSHPVSPDTLNCLASTLAKIHSVCPPDVQVDLKSAWQRYIAMSGKQQGRWQRHADRLLPILEQDRDFCFCHNDLHIQHVFIEGSGTRVIDWEYAGLGHRAFDLCATIKINGLDEQAMRDFMKAYSMYSGLEVESLLENVARMAPVVDFTNDLWHNAVSL
ncbi:MAG: phosphotransferase [Aestuariibacter sp.]